MSMYLDIQKPNKIQGESAATPANPNWDKKIEVHFMSHTVSHTETPQTGSGLVSSGADPSFLHITKTMDRSTPYLFGHLAGGVPIELMFLRVSKSGKAKASPTDDGQYEGETYEMHNVIVTNYSTSGTPGPGGLPLENWQFSFTWVNESYQTTDPATGRLIKPGVAVAGFDFGQNTAV